jgi:MarR family transcriptional regulator, lower aerobic nicotinate degradation pathway regulator
MIGLKSGREGSMTRRSPTHHKDRKGADDRLRAFYQMPGHLIRRSKQKSTAAFMDAFAEFDITPIQYAVLHVLQIMPALDRAELCELVGLDNSTIGGVLARLKKRKLLLQHAEGRRHLISSTPAAGALLARMSKIMPEVQASILHPLTARERQQLIRLLAKLVGVSRPLWRHPLFRLRPRAIAFTAIEVG